MDGWIKLELDNSNRKIVIEPKDKKTSYSKLIYVYI